MEEKSRADRVCQCAESEEEWSAWCCTGKKPHHPHE